MNDCGIYEIVNRLDGRRYVGSSTQIQKRLSDHRKMLIGGKHHSVFLQRAWAKYGEANFTFRPVAFLEQSELTATEQRFIDCVFRDDEQYNVSKNNLSPMRGLKHNAETLARMSVSRIGNKSRTGVPGHWSKDSPPPSLAALIAKSRNPSPETREKMRQAKVGWVPHNKGKKYPHAVCSQETRQKLRDAALRQWARQKKG